MSFKDMTGQVCGNLTVVGFSSVSEKNGQAMWRCQCACGNEKVAHGRDLRDGNTKSCGCRGHLRSRAAIPVSGRRTCVRCEVEKPISDFMFSAQTKTHKDYCRDCNARRVAREVPSRAAARLRQQTKNADTRARALNHYGSRCQCCGEETPVFLAFDHINGGGNQQRGDLRRQKFSTIAAWLEASAYPDDFQVLCNNCNWAKHANQVCPHQIDAVVAALSMGG